MHDANKSMSQIKYPQSQALSRKCRCVTGRRVKHISLFTSASCLVIKLKQRAVSLSPLSCAGQSEASKEQCFISLHLLCSCSLPIRRFSFWQVSAAARCIRHLPETCRIIKPSAHHCGQRENRPCQGLIQLQTRPDE